MAVKKNKETFWFSNLFIFKRRCINISLEGCSILNSGLSLRGGDWGSPPATKNVAPSYSHRKKRRKIEPKEIPSCLILRLLVVFTPQLEILVTAL